ncbi:MAG: hypothetical protein DRQ59_00810 [Gammaproteobacteria bacterium]|nr:MAG: hypothetical protein DRQ59_00810 [Gammaproteobacteria bacterium]
MIAVTPEKIDESMLLMYKKPVFLPLLLWFIMSLRAVYPAAIEFDRSSLIINGDQYSIEIAKTSSQRQQGLMFRESLSIRQGMLFVYPRPGNHRIWMKNTLIPLSVIWIDDNETVIEVKILPPCRLDFCPSYGVSEPAKYIIELSSEVMGIKSGDSIKGVKQFE